MFALKKKTAGSDFVVEMPLRGLEWGLAGMGSFAALRMTGFIDDRFYR
jgi:hypothetical protein